MPAAQQAEGRLQNFCVCTPESQVGLVVYFAVLCCMACAVLSGALCEPEPCVQFAGLLALYFSSSVLLLQGSRLLSSPCFGETSSAEDSAMHQCKGSGWCKSATRVLREHACTHTGKLYSRKKMRAGTALCAESAAHRAKSRQIRFQHYTKTMTCNTINFACRGSSLRRVGCTCTRGKRRRHPSSPSVTSSL